MKTLICTTGFVWLCFSGLAQTKAGTISRVFIDANGFSAPPAVRDTIPPYKGFDRKLPYNGIPNAITLLPAPLVYRGNNGRGMDMYESGIDHMPILMPDGGFGSNMPNAISGAGKIKDSVRSPLYTPEFLYKKNWQPNIFRYPK